MKTSKRWLIGSSVVISFIFLVALILLKLEARQVVRAYALKSNLSRVAVEDFHSVVIGSGFDARVEGWLEPTVSVDTSAGATTRLENLNGTLYFELQVDSIAPSDEPRELVVRVKGIQSVTLRDGSTLQLSDVQTDSLYVMLEDSKSLHMINCSIGHLEITSRDGLKITSTQIKE